MAGTDPAHIHPARTGPRRPRILQVITHLDLGGAEEVAIALSEQLQDDYDIRFFAVNGIQDTAIGKAMQARLRIAGVPVHSGTRLQLKRGGFVQAAARLAALRWRLRPDIVHLHTEIPELTYALSRGFRPQSAREHRPQDTRATLTTRTLHNTTFWGPWRGMGVRVERCLLGVPLAACSQGALEGMQAFRATNALPLLAAAQGQVIYNGVAPAPLQAEHAGAAADLDTASDLGTAAGRPLRVMFAGRLEPQKGADLLPAILEHAGRGFMTADAMTTNPRTTDPVSALPSAELTIYGAGSLETTLVRWAAQGVPGWTIRIVPPTPELRAEMARHDLLLMPSRFEGLPLVAAEALMAGLPVVATRAPGMTEVFPDGYPLLAPCEDTLALGNLLAQVLGNPDGFRAQSRRWMAPTTEKFGLARMAREYSGLYQNLLNGRSLTAQAQPSGAL